MKLNTTLKKPENSVFNNNKKPLGGQRTAANCHKGIIFFTLGQRGGGHRALDGGQFRFWSNLKVLFYVHLRHISVIWDISSHI